MKKVKLIFLGLIFGSLTLLTSCLKLGLDDLPVYNECDITNVYFDYRYKDPAAKWTDGSPIVKYVSLTLATKTIDAAANTVNVSITVPAASGTFTSTERANVALTNIVCSLNLSTAAIISPEDGSPELGGPGDFSSPRKYKVIAADGKTSKTWTVTVTALNKP